MAWQGAITLSEMVKNSVSLNNLSQPTTLLLFSLTRFLATPLGVPPQQSDQRFLHFVCFLLCGKPSPMQEQNYR